MKKLLSLVFVIAAISTTLSATEVVDDKSVIRGEQSHPDKGILY